MARILIGNIKGPKGATGAQGPKGATGPQGPAGPTGVVDTNTPVTFTEATADTDITSGDTLGTIAGKIRKSIKTLRTNLGALTGLKTTAKGSAVAAINEVYASNVDLAQSLASKAPASHTHTRAQVSDLSGASVNYATSAGSANAVAWGNVSGKPSTYTPSGHTHDDRYYTEAEVNNLLGGKAAASHSHDDRYYTESEVNSRLSGKLDASRVKSRSWVATVTGNYLDVAFSSVGLTNNVNYVIIVNNANRAANTLTVTGVSLLQQPPSTFRIYWDDTFSSAVSVQFNLLAVQI